MSLSHRHAIHWPKSQTSESEETSTVVITSPSGLFVDVRVFLPLSSTTTPSFEWFFAGQEIEHDEATIEFKHDFYDSMYIENDLTGNEKPFVIGTDIGHFSDPTDPADKAAGIRIEKGEMVNPKTNILEPYIEKWITCDPLKGPELSYIGDTPSKKETVHCVVMQTVGASLAADVETDGVIGRIIKYGDWVQGVFWKRNGDVGSKLKDCVGVYRAYKDYVFIKYGAFGDHFPDLNVSGVGETVEFRDVKWKVIEFI